MPYALPVLSLSKDALCFFKFAIRNSQFAIISLNPTSNIRNLKSPIASSFSPSSLLFSEKLTAKGSSPMKMLF